ncbi:MAG: tetratricopeptide repeat protein [Planctomycetota bacterium]
MRSSFSVVVLLLACGCGKQQADSSPTGTQPAVPLSISAPQPDAAAAKAGTDWPPEIRALLQRASTSVRQGRHATAIESLSQAIGIRPDDATLFRMRGDVYALIGENANARADFSTAIRLQPRNADLYNFRGYFLMSHGLGKDALADFDQAVLLDPAHTAALNNRGLLRLSEQDFAAAEADFTKAIESSRSFPDAWNNRGFARMKKQELEPAMADIRQALKLNENYVTAWNNRGLIAMQQQNYAEAVQAFGRAVELEPLDLRWIGHRRAALLKMERFGEATADASRIEWLTRLQEQTQEVRRSPSSAEAWLRRGRLLMEGREFAAAVEDLTRVLLLSPKQPEALTARAHCWVELKDSEKAMLDCNEAVNAGAGGEALSLRGDLRATKRDYDLALEDYAAAQRFDADVADVLDARAEQLRAAGKTAEADADVDEARRIRDALAGQSAARPSTQPAEDAAFNSVEPETP